MNIQDIDSSVDIRQVLQWEDNEAASVISLINDKQLYFEINQTGFWQDWYNDIFNLLTANDFGLSVWSIILDVPYLVPITGAEKPIWGFNQVPLVNLYVNYERGNFARGTSRIILNIEEQRIFLRLRYFKLISDGAITSINVFLNLLFDDPLGIFQGGAWAIDNFDMSMEYVFNVPISTNLLNAIIFYEILPNPTGVELFYTVL